MQYIPRELSEIIIEKERVYKRYYADHLTKPVIKELLEIDRIYNINPIFIDTIVDYKTPFKSYTSRGKFVLVMRKLKEENQILNIIKQGGTKPLLTKLAESLRKAHTNTQSLSGIGKDFLMKRFTADLLLLKNMVNKLLDYKLKTCCKTLICLIEENYPVLDNRVLAGCVKRIHGDLDLGHIYREGSYFTYLDFSDFDKYRTDDEARDVSGVALNLIELGKHKASHDFVTYYANLLPSNPNTNEAVWVQLVKKALLKYYIYSGGFDAKHRDDQKLTDYSKTIMVVKDCAENFI